MTIGNKVLINILILCTLAASIYGYVFLGEQKKYAEAQLIKRTQAFGESMREIIEANLTSENLPYLKKLLNRITVFEQPMGLRIYLKNGENFYQTKSLKKIPDISISQLIQEMGEDEAFVEKKNYLGKAFIVCSFPIESEEGNLLGILQIFDYQSVISGDLKGYQRKVFTSLMLFFLFSLTVIFFVIRKNINQPIATLIREVQNKNGNEGSVQKGHELTILKQEFTKRESHLQQLENVLFESVQEKEELLDQLQQSEKLAVIGKFAADLAHEMGSPISVIEGRAAQALKKANEAQVVEKNLNLIVTQSQRLSKMIKDVLAFGRRRPIHKTSIDLNRVLSQALELFEEKIRSPLELEKRISPHLPKVEGDPDQLLQVFINLIQNAIEAMPRGGKLTLSTDQVTDNGNLLPWVRISIKDTGVGIKEEAKAHLFEPFFSQRANGEGTGLGLSIVYGIIQEHEGHILVQSKPNQGSQFDVYLPIRERKAVSTSSKRLMTQRLSV